MHGIAGYVIGTMRFMSILLETAFTIKCNSSRFSLLSNLKGTFERSRYIDTIKDPKTRVTFTCLRIDMNPFSTYMRKEITGTSTCPLCISGYDSMTHLFYECPILDDKRTMMCNAVEEHIPTWPHMDVDEKIYLMPWQRSWYMLCVCSWSRGLSWKMHGIISGFILSKQTFNCLPSPK